MNGLSIDTAPDARRVASRRSLEARRKPAQGGHETRWNSHYVLHSDESDASSKGNERHTSDRMIGCCTIRRISRIYLHARLTRIFFHFATIPPFRKIVSTFYHSKRISLLILSVSLGAILRWLMLILAPILICQLCQHETCSRQIQMLRILLG